LSHISVTHWVGGGGFIRQEGKRIPDEILIFASKHIAK
jgi:hypothetical protein